MTNILENKNQSVSVNKHHIYIRLYLINGKRIHDIDLNIKKLGAGTAIKLDL